MPDRLRGEIANMGPCAKQTVRCTLVTPDGEHIPGENWCANPQPTCPRDPGEGYEKCRSVCAQEGHAEQVAVRLAGDRAKGARAYIEGHTYACMNCQHALFAAGVVSLSIGTPA
jgi:deoxycytidylate deaminase